MDDFSRRRWFSAGAVALVGLPLLVRFATAAEAAEPADIDALNAAIELERAGIEAYADAQGTGLLSPPVLAVAKRFSADHTAHRDALMGAVRAAGRTPSAAVGRIEAPPLASERDVLQFASVVEAKAASTYLSVVPDLRDRTLAGVTASILGVESAHVALLAQVLGKQWYPGGFVV